MPGMVTVEVYGAEMVAEELLSVGNRGADMVPMWPRVIAKLEEIEREQYATMGARSGNVWEPLDNSYMFHKFQQGLSLDVMKATEATYEALTGTTGDSVRTASFDSLQFGADLPQFAIHQDPQPSSSFPTRLPIDLTAMDVADVSRMIEIYIMGNFAVGDGPAIAKFPKNARYNPKVGRWQSRSTGRFVKGPTV